MEKGIGKKGIGKKPILTSVERKSTMESMHKKSPL